ncbi:MAG: hypothetical protein ISR67_06680, partial [Sulfurimonas sp.]|nr:hypothetical protein [Sulfurimonas sp.]
MKSTFIKASIVTATVSVVLATLGCSSGGSGGLGGAISSAFGGSDGYVISLPEAATTSLGKSTTKVTAPGKITFDRTVEENEIITIPASAIIDRNNNGEY